MNVLHEFCLCTSPFWGSAEYLGRAVKMLPLVLAIIMPQQSFEKWLGPQSKLTSIRMKSIPSDAVAEKAIGRWRITISVLKGSQIKLEKSANATVTVKDGQFAEVKDDFVISDRKYIVGKMVIRQKGGSPNFYNVRARVKTGPLAGAVINLLDGTSRSDTGATSSCIYLIPSDTVVEEGDLSFEVFEVSYK